MLTTILSIIKAVLAYFSILLERNKEKKAKEKEAFNEVVAGIKDRDPSRITAGFDKLKRVQ